MAAIAGAWTYQSSVAGRASRPRRPSGTASGATSARSHSNVAALERLEALREVLGTGEFFYGIDVYETRVETADGFKDRGCQQDVFIVVALT